MNEHEDSQCCIVCLMSHGEEGFLTTKDGEKVVKHIFLIEIDKIFFSKKFIFLHKSKGFAR